MYNPANGLATTTSQEQEQDQANQQSNQVSGFTESFKSHKKWKEIVWILTMRDYRD